MKHRRTNNGGAVKFLWDSFEKTIPFHDTRTPNEPFASENIIIRYGSV